MECGNTLAGEHQASKAAFPMAKDFGDTKRNYPYR
jgi:hypothetical protein